MQRGGQMCCFKMLLMFPPVRSVSMSRDVRSVCCKYHISLIIKVMSFRSHILSAELNAFKITCYNNTSRICVELLLRMGPARYSQIVPLHTVKVLESRSADSCLLNSAADWGEGFRALRSVRWRNCKKGGIRRTLTSLLYSVRIPVMHFSG